jgi:Cu(I)/Ag(I) efflux system membrane protein CusA/SilA
MIESVVTLRPRDEWPTRQTHRWYSDYAPEWLEPVFRTVWPEEQARTPAELSRDLDAALRMPGYQMAIGPPIRTRIDMLTTGVRTPVGIKVFGDNLTEIARVSIALEGLLRQVPGTRSTFAERQTGREYVDIVPNRDAIARYDLTVRDVQDVVEAAVGGMPVSTGRVPSLLPSSRVAGCGRSRPRRPRRPRLRVSGCDRHARIARTPHPGTRPSRCLSVGSGCGR